LDGGGSEGICTGAADGAIHETVFGGLVLRMENQWLGNLSSSRLFERSVNARFSKQVPTCMLKGSGALLRSI
jgi:hypothetical protein